MDKKILDFPEAAELANDDYIIFDSESGGGCRILAKKIAPVIYGIEATYTQTQEVTEDTPLDDLRQDLVVEAIYQHNRKKVVTDYTLSGTLSTGTSTVTVTYSGFTTTFNVEVAGINYLYNWDFTQSLIDSVRGQAAVLTNASRTDNDGVICQSNGKINLLNNYVLDSKTLEIDFKELSKTVSVSYGLVLLKTNNYSFFLYYNNLWRSRKNSSYMSYESTSSRVNFSNVTIQFIFGAIEAQNNLTVYVIDKTTDEKSLLYYGNAFSLGSQYSPWLDILGELGTVIVTGVRIYDNV